MSVTASSPLLRRTAMTQMTGVTSLAQMRPACWLLVALNTPSAAAAGGNLASLGSACWLFFDVSAEPLVSLIMHPVDGSTITRLGFDRLFQTACFKHVGSVGSTSCKAGTWVLKVAPASDMLCATTSACTHTFCVESFVFCMTPLWSLCLGGALLLQGVLMPGLWGPGRFCVSSFGLW